MKNEDGEFMIGDTVRCTCDGRSGKISKISESCGVRFYHIPSIGTCGFICRARVLKLVYRPKIKCED